jgi:hypothetical protein
MSGRHAFIAASIAALTATTALAQAVHGTVVDSTTGIPLRNARLAVVDRSVDAVTDSSGGFRLSGLAAGHYTLVVRTPSLDSLGASYNVTLDVAGDSTSIAVRVPTALQVAAFACQQDLGTGGVLLGRLTSPDDTAASRTGIVTAEWQPGTVSTSAAASPLWVSASSDARGRFALCGVPLDVELTLKAVTEGASGGPTRATVPVRARFGRTEVILDRKAASAVFTGVVTLDTTREPIGGVEVALPDLSRTTLTNERGTFMLREIPPGDQHVVVRRLGYGPVDTRLTFQAGRVVQRRFALTRAVVLDSVQVTGRASDHMLDDYEANRRLRLGHFLSREDLAKLEGVSTGAAIRSLTGTEVHSRSTYAWVRGSHSFSMAPQVPELDPVDALKGAFRTNCYSIVYLDDRLVFRNRVLHTVANGVIHNVMEPLFDVNSIPVSEIESLEFYSSAAEMPARYRNTDSECGVLIIHTIRYHKVEKPPA